MEKIVRFRFNYSDIHEEVKKITSYIAKNRVSENVVPIDAILDTQDMSIFDTFIRNAEAKVFDCVSGYFVFPNPSQYEEDEAADDGMIVFNLLFPDSFNDNSARQINTEIRSALTNHVLGEWLLIVSPDDAAIYLQKAELNEKNLKFKLSNRTKTVLRPLTSFP